MTTSESSESERALPSMHTSVGTPRPSEEADEALLPGEAHHRRILRAQRSFDLLKDDTLAFATDQRRPPRPALLDELRRSMDEEMACGSEALACVHLAALIYASAADNDAEADGAAADPMTAYLAQRRALNYAFFHYGTMDAAQARDAASDLFARFVRINRAVRHDWTGRSIFVSPIHENAGVALELPNPAFRPVPIDASALLHLPKRARVETPTVEQHVELAAANDDFRAVQLHFFYELRLMVDFADALDARVTQHVRCDFDPAANTVGWMVGLFRDHSATRILIPMQENIHAAFLYPGDIRHMAVTLHYDDLSLVSPSVVASTIASDTYADVSAQLVGNMPRLWAEMAALPLDAAKEAVLAWDVRAGVLLHHFYLLHIMYMRTKADAAVLPISIYTLRRTFDSAVFAPHRFANKLLLFRRRAYLCRADGTAACFSGYHAMEHGLRAWAAHTYGEQSQLVRVLSMVHVPAADAIINDLPAPQTNLSAQTTHVPNSAYASSMPQGSIFATGGS